jgi:hypothetical protein
LQDKKKFTQQACTAKHHVPNILPVFSNILHSTEGEEEGGREERGSVCMHGGEISNLPSLNHHE